jgi:hypothetical protein
LATQFFGALALAAGLAIQRGARPLDARQPLQHDAPVKIVSPSLPSTSILTVLSELGDFGF